DRLDHTEPTRNDPGQLVRQTCVNDWVVPAEVMRREERRAAETFDLEWARELLAKAVTDTARSKSCERSHEEDERCSKSGGGTQKCAALAGLRSSRQQQRQQQNGIELHHRADPDQESRRRVTPLDQREQCE